MSFSSGAQPGVVAFAALSIWCAVMMEFGLGFGLSEDSVMGLFISFLVGFGGVGGEAYVGDDEEAEFLG